jgi:hypothetical protein
MDSQGFFGGWQRSKEALTLIILKQEFAIAIFLTALQGPASTGRSKFESDRNGFPD